MFCPQACLVLGLLSWCTLLVDSRVSREEMFPFGPSNGDSTLPKCLSCYEGPVKLKIPILLGPQEYNELYVNTDGIISFNSGIDFYPKTCGARSRQWDLLIAPFWTDVDTRRGGHVYYRESTDPHILARASKEVLNASSPDLTFHLPLISAFIVTWDNVSYARSDPCSDTLDRNTFQAILANDASGSTFVIFYYNDLTWTGGLFGADSWSCEWQLKDHASAGVSHGLFPHDFHDILGNCPSPVLNLVDKSNINQVGKWIFQLDSYHTEKKATAAPATTTRTGIPTTQITTTTDPSGLTSPSPTIYREEIVMPMKLTHMMRRVMSFISLNFFN